MKNSTEAGREVVALFESRDPNHRYVVRDLGFWNFNSDVNYTEVFRKGLLFKKRVARITYVDTPSLNEANVATFRGCPANITHDEIWEAYSKGLERRASTQASSHPLLLRR
jgi:hypothetical protein